MEPDPSTTMPLAGLDPGLAMGLAGLFALLSAALIMLLLARLTQAAPAVGLGWRGEASPPGAWDDGLAAFLFDGEELIDATPAARRLLRGVDRRSSDLDAVLALLARRFGGDLGHRLRDLPPGGRIRLADRGGRGGLEAEALDEGVRLTLDLPPDTVPAEGEEGLDRLRLEAALEELDTLRALAEDAPQMIWALDAAGTLAWANRAYLALSDLALGLPEDAVPTWPTVPLFEPPPGLLEGQPDTRRQSLPLPGREEPHWFDVTSIRRGAGSVHFAADAGSLVQAEAARHHFVQTLAKTFAHLATGLAIFDRSRRLVLFNPAFIDLTGRAVPFLSTRPPVHAVLDRLRDAKILPEPRNYGTWRDEVAALEAAAARGHYCETWTLPGGQTWRVTGRPHPDGALAFLFEDISDEIALTRRFRAELDAAQGALDGIEEAVATFSPTGMLGLSNAAYAALWGPPAGGLSEPALTGEALRWEGRCAPSPFWDRLRAVGAGLRAPAEGELLLAGGGALRCRATLLAGGGTLVTFQALRPASAASRTGAEALDPPPAGPPPDGADLVAAGARGGATERDVATAALEPDLGPRPDAPAIPDMGPPGFASRRLPRRDGRRASGLAELRARFAPRPDGLAEVRS